MSHHIETAQSQYIRNWKVKGYILQIEDQAHIKKYEV